MQYKAFIMIVSLLFVLSCKAEERDVTASLKVKSAENGVVAYLTIVNNMDIDVAFPEPFLGVCSNAHLLNKYEVKDKQDKRASFHGFGSVGTRSYVSIRAKSSHTFEHPLNAKYDVSQLDGPIEVQYKVKILMEKDGELFSIDIMSNKVDVENWGAPFSPEPIKVTPNCKSHYEFG